MDCGTNQHTEPPMSRKIKKEILKEFACRRCGFCCSLPGLVMLEEGEPEKIAAFLGLSVYDFTERFTFLTAGRRKLSLIEKENGHCIFLQNDMTCRIQDVKPVQCTGFPHAWTSGDLEKECEGLRDILVPAMLVLDVVREFHGHRKEIICVS